MRHTDLDTVRRWEAEPDRTTQLLDVRTPDEFAAGHLRGSVSAPGGQLVQATDEYVGTQGARLVVIDDDATRATMTASWLQQMNWDVWVLSGVDQMTDTEIGSGSPPVDVPAVPTSGPGDLQGALIVDLATSTEHRRGHLPGSIWAVRGRLADTAGRHPASRVVLVSPDGVLAALAHKEAAQAWPDAEVSILAGGAASYSGDLESGLDHPGTPDDVWQLPYDPGDATVAREAMEGYLIWEVDLVPQYDGDPLVEFNLA